MVAATLRDRIADRTYAPGSRLPSAKVIAAEHGCSLSPVVSAIKLLGGEGLVRLIPFATALVPDEAAEQAQLLAALRLVWGAHYQITTTAGGWEAWRLDGSGAVEAATVAELAALLLEDWPKYAMGVAL
jgi:DNA-binding transcriptional MocR family regulator